MNSHFNIWPISMDNELWVPQSNTNSVTLHLVKFGKNPSIKLVKRPRDSETLISGASKAAWLPIHEAVVNVCRKNRPLFYRFADDIKCAG